MRLVFAAVVLLLIGFVALGCGSSPTTLPNRISNTLRIATYNVHYLVLGKQTGAWSVDDSARRKGPLDAAFGALDFSDTPDTIYSPTYNGSYPAFASWARFEDLESGNAFTVVNMHFEFKSFSNRAKSASLVAERTALLIKAGEHVLLAGDLNAWHGMQPLETLEQIGLNFLPVRGATYHMNHGINLIGAIDHIAHTTGLQPVGEPVVLRNEFDGEWPTDHYPVIADFRFASD